MHVQSSHDCYAFIFATFVGFVRMLVAFVSQASWALAGSSGGIAGTVTDAQRRAPIPGVGLQISSPSQTVTTTTDFRAHVVVFSLETQQCDLSLSPAPPATPPAK